MRVRVIIEEAQMKINEAFTGKSAEEIVAGAKARVARELPFAMRLMVSAMPNLAFAQEVVKRYNEAKKTNVPLPKSCAEFLQLAQEQGFAVIEEA